MSVYEDMARDAGARGDEIRQMAQMISADHERDAARYEAEMEEGDDMREKLSDEFGAAYDSLFQPTEEQWKDWVMKARALETSLAQARADVEALRRVDQTAEALILSIGYPKDRLLVARYMSAKGALPEHLRGASR